MYQQISAMALIAAMGSCGLAISNFLHDRGVSRLLTRRVAPTIGGVAYLVSILTLNVWNAVLLSAALTLVIAGLRLRYQGGLRGVQGNDRQTWAEITYPLAGTIGLAVGWGLLGDRWLAFVPIAFMAWGDGVAGSTRALPIRDGLTSMGPSVAMLAATLAMAALYQPYWIGAAGALTATFTERFRPAMNSLWDDNWVIVVASLSVMWGLSRAL